MTLSEIKALSDDELRVRVAELCGWTRIGTAHDGRPYGLPAPDLSVSKTLPDYPRDLNAIHKAEETLTEEQKWNYGNTLALEVLAPENSFLGEEQPNEPELNGYGHYHLARLSARQRAEAFVLTLQPLPAQT